MITRLQRLQEIALAVLGPDYDPDAEDDIDEPVALPPYLPPNVPILLLGNYGYPDSLNGGRGSTYVYFARRASDGAIKIGISTGPMGRQTELRAQLHTRVDMLAWLPGNDILERSLHVRFGHLRLDGEWFQPTRRLLNVIDDVRREMVSRGEPLPEEQSRPARGRKRG